MAEQITLAFSTLELATVVRALSHAIEHLEPTDGEPLLQSRALVVAYFKAIHAQRKHAGWRPRTAAFPTAALEAVAAVLTAPAPHRARALPAKARAAKATLPLPLAAAVNSEV